MRSPVPISTHCYLLAGKLDEAPGAGSSSVLGMRSTQDQPLEGHLPLIRTTLLQLFCDSWRVKLLGKWKREKKREKIWISKGIYKWSNSAASMSRGRDKMLENKKFCKNAFWYDKTKADQVSLFWHICEAHPFSYQVQESPPWGVCGW